MDFPASWARELEQSLPRYVCRQRWFGGKARTIQHIRLAQAIALPKPSWGEPGQADTRSNCDAPRFVSVGWESPRATVPGLWLLILAVDYADGGRDWYTLPVAVTAPEGVPAAQTVIASNVQPDEGRCIVEATRSPDFWLALARLLARPISSDAQGAGESQTWRVVHTSAFSSARIGPFSLGEATVFGGEQSQSLAVLGKEVVIKLFRRLEAGISPDWEIGRFLTEQQHFAHVPAALAALEYQADGLDGTVVHGTADEQKPSEPTTLAILTSYCPNHGDAWSCIVAELASETERVRQWEPAEFEHYKGQLSESTDQVARLLRWAVEPVPGAGPGILGPLASQMGLLGQRTAQLHLALANSGDPAFAPEPIDFAWQIELAESSVRQIRQTWDLLRRRLAGFAPTTAQLARQVVQLEERFCSQVAEIGRFPFNGLRIRIHGDYHLGQVLCTQGDFIILDFEGEPAKPLAERRSKQSPLRDLAGMIRSFQYATAFIARAQGENWEPWQQKYLAAWLRQWYYRTAALFLHGYLHTPGIARLIPTNPSDLQLLLRVFLIQKATYELAYELNHRPDWGEIPLQGLVELAG